LKFLMKKCHVLTPPNPYYQQNPNPPHPYYQQIPSQQYYPSKP
jgi:hypothetical protein